jgi:RNA polymerase sigma-70 factor, ECF subfamily
LRKSVCESVAFVSRETERSLPNQLDKLELRDLDRALARLSAEKRAVILAVGLDGLRYGTVAKTLGIAVGTVGSRLCHGRQELRRLMGYEDTELEDQCESN